MSTEICLFSLEGYVYGAVTLRTSENCRETEQEAFERWFAKLPSDSPLKKERENIEIQTTLLDALEA